LVVALILLSACSSEVQQLESSQSSTSTNAAETVDATTTSVEVGEDGRRAIEIARAYPFSAREVAAREGTEPPVVRPGPEESTRLVDIRFAEPVSEYVLRLAACGEGRPTDIVVGLRFLVDLEAGQVQRMTPVWINGSDCF
jgi:hypothetical protein